MCGIAGFCSTFSSVSVSFDEALLHAIDKVLAHRGPDGAGVWTSAEDAIALIHRRLRILDVSDRATQPMHDDEHSVVVIFNGEIYNYRELNKELLECGFRFKTTSDTETILYAYKAWGINFLKRLDGMFAIALFDRTQKKLYLVRDRIGIKPLYFSLQAERLSFASELKALWQMPWIEKKINLQMLSSYLSYLAIPAPYTLYQQVYKLPAGHYVCLDANKQLTVTQWYDLLDAPIYSSSDEQASFDQLNDLIVSAVQKRCISDVPVGVFLSGGLDSSLVTAIMAQMQSLVKTFTVTFSDGPELAETEWAQRVAQHVGAEHHELFITEREAYESCEQVMYHQDEPLADSVCLPLYAVAHFAKKQGISVVQVGEGADELFAGYQLYAQHLKWQEVWRVTQQMLPLPLRKGLYYAARPLFDRYTVKRGLLEEWMRGNHFFASSVYLFSQDAQRALLHAYEQPQEDLIITQLFGKDVQTNAIDYYRDCWNARRTSDTLNLIAYLELMYRLPELILTRTDKMTMAASIEARVPFLDYRLVEYALQMPGDLKIRNGVAKYALKKVAERFLPHDIIYRKKMGFAAPIVRWFTNGSYFKPSLQDRLNHQGGWADIINPKQINYMLTRHEQQKENYAYHLWTVYNLLPFLE